MIKVHIKEFLLNTETQRFHKIVEIFGIKVYEKIIDSNSRELIEEYTQKSTATANAGFKIK